MGGVRVPLPRSGTPFAQSNTHRSLKLLCIVERVGCWPEMPVVVGRLERVASVGDRAGGGLHPVRDGRREPRHHAHLGGGLGDDLGRSTDVIPALGAALSAMLYIPERDILVVITAANMLATFKLTDNKPLPLVKAKLSVGRDGLLDSCFCGLGLLACVSNDQVVRVNDLIEDNEADDESDKEADLAM